MNKTDCLICNGRDKWQLFHCSQFHTCHRGEWQRNPFALIGRKFKSIVTNHNQQEITLTGTFVRYGGLRDQCLYYLPGSESNPNPKINIFSDAFHVLELK